MMAPKKHFFQPKFLFTFGGLFLIVLFAGLRISSATAAQAEPESQNESLHPTFPLLDEEGEQVQLSGKPISTMKTCAACHDTQFIESHSFHADVGLSEYHDPGEGEGIPAWDTSTSLYGKWDPIANRYLTPEGDDRLDLGTAGWIQTLGVRHVGGGPAVYARNGERLDQLETLPGDPETHVLDPETGEWVPWDWSESGVVEMNCFLCHTPTPDNQARIQELHEGNFKWANSATLMNTGVIFQTEDEFQWDLDAFEPDGELKENALVIQDPDNDNCGLCHGLVHDDLNQPLTITGCSPERYRTVTTGQIISPQRLSDTGMNLQDKETLSRTWDIHAERLLTCTDCHYSLNNPIYYEEVSETRPDHLLFDPRRLDLEEYLNQPLHQFARGQSAQSTVAEGYKDTMRRCESCHSIEATHDWLPYKERHMDTLSCETCHIPKMYVNTLQQLDWTVLQIDGNPVPTCRGVEGDPSTLTALITGYEPVLLPRTEYDGETKITPLNLVTTWFWIYGDDPRPVRQIDLQAAWFADGEYRPEIVELFDQNGDGNLEKAELAIDSEEKEALIAGYLESLGVVNPRIIGEVQPYSINHDVVGRDWAIKDCNTCHAEDSRISQPFNISSHTPPGAEIDFVGDSNILFTGELVSDAQNAIVFQPELDQQGWYLLGHNNVSWVDKLGGFTFLGMLLGITIHGGLRFFTSLREKHNASQVETVYMYGIYERLWHWLQTFAIVSLLATGLIIHKPDIFGLFNFRSVVLVHNILAAILVVNAGLSLFYHLASGEIRQYIPRPRGFFDQTILQAKYYLRGIFKREIHPFEKTPQKKLNPLQQITYVGILNVLLPLQVLTGILMWGAQQWPDLAARFGGLPFLAPFHSLIAWFFASFIVLHVYLTTTGHAPFDSIKAMMMGWDQVETHGLQIQGEEL
jgi:thiosulfate reductase cytochrome b subunit